MSLKQTITIVSALACVSGCGGDLGPIIQPPKNHRLALGHKAYLTFGYTNTCNSSGFFDSCYRRPRELQEARSLDPSVVTIRGGSDGIFTFEGRSEGTAKVIIKDQIDQEYTVEIAVSPIEEIVFSSEPYGPPTQMAKKGLYHLRNTLYASAFDAQGYQLVHNLKTAGLTVKDEQEHELKAPPRVYDAKTSKWVIDESKIEPSPSKIKLQSLLHGRYYDTLPQQEDEDLYQLLPTYVSTVSFTAYQKAPTEDPTPYDRHTLTIDVPRARNPVKVTLHNLSAITHVEANKDTSPDIQRGEETSIRSVYGMQFMHNEEALLGSLPVSIDTIYEGTKGWFDHYISPRAWSTDSKDHVLVLGAQTKGNCIIYQSTNDKYNVMYKDYMPFGETPCTLELRSDLPSIDLTPVIFK